MVVSIVACSHSQLAEIPNHKTLLLRRLDTVILKIFMLRSQEYKDCGNYCVHCLNVFKKQIVLMQTKASPRTSIPHFSY